MIAGFLGGEIVGDKNAAVHTVSSIEEGRAGSLAYLTNPKYEPWLYKTEASIVLVDKRSSRRNLLRQRSSRSKMRVPA